MFKPDPCQYQTEVDYNAACLEAWNFEFLTPSASPGLATGIAGKPRELTLYEFFDLRRARGCPTIRQGNLQHVGGLSQAEIDAWLAEVAAGKINRTQAERKAALDKVAREKYGGGTKGGTGDKLPPFSLPPPRKDGLPPPRKDGADQSTGDEKPPTAPAPSLTGPLLALGALSAVGLVAAIALLRHRR